MKKHCISLICVIALSCLFITSKHVYADVSYDRSEVYDKEELLVRAGEAGIFFALTIIVNSAMGYAGLNSNDDLTILRTLSNLANFGEAQLWKQLIVPALLSGSITWLANDYLLLPQTSAARKKLQQQRDEWKSRGVVEYLQEQEKDMKLQLNKKDQEVSEALALDISKGDDVERLKIMYKFDYPLLFVDDLLCNARKFYKQMAVDGDYDVQEKIDGITQFVMKLRKTKQYQQEKSAFEAAEKEKIVHELKEKEITAQAAVALGFNRNTKAVERLDKELSDQMRQFGSNNRKHMDQNNRQERNNQQQTANNREQDAATQRSVQASNELGKSSAFLAMQSGQLASVGNTVGVIKEKVNDIASQQQSDSRKFNALSGKLDSVQGAANHIKKTTDVTKEGVANLNAIAKASASPRPPAYNPELSQPIVPSDSASAPPMDNDSSDSNYPGLYPDISK